jgi:hypothetical protein
VAACQAPLAPLSVLRWDGGHSSPCVCYHRSGGRPTHFSRSRANRNFARAGFLASQQPADNGNRHLRKERFLYPRAISVRTGTCTCAFYVVTGHENHHDFRCTGANSADGLVTIDPGHPHIRKDRIEAPAFADTQRLFPTCSRSHLVTCTAECMRQQPKNRRLIIDYQNCRHTTEPA